jgi:hypothetical protein
MACPRPSSGQLRRLSADRPDISSCGALSSMALNASGTRRTSAALWRRPCSTLAMSCAADSGSASHT